LNSCFPAIALDFRFGRQRCVGSRTTGLWFGLLVRWQVLHAPVSQVINQARASAGSLSWTRQLVFGAHSLLHVPTLFTSTALQFSLPSVLDLAASVLVPSPVWFPIQISVRHFTIGLSFQLKSGFCHHFLLGCDLVSSADLARTVIRAWMLLFCALRCSISVLFDSPLTVVLDLVRFLAG
jgi:hypothetical protein